MSQPRKKTRLAAEFRAGEVQGSGRIRNVSEGGLFLGTAVIPAQGELAEVTFSPPGEPPIQLQGLVWWTTDESGGRHRTRGFGLRLLEEDARYASMVGRLRG